MSLWEHCVYLSLSFLFQHMYASNEISSVYGRGGTKLSPTLAAFVNGVAVSINRWNKWVTIVPSRLHQTVSDTLNHLPQPNYIWFSVVVPSEQPTTVWVDENTKLNTHYPLAEISHNMSANMSWLPSLANDNFRPLATVYFIYLLFFCRLTPWTLMIHGTLPLILQEQSFQLC